MARNQPTHQKDRARRTRAPGKSAPQRHLYEADVPEGLEAIAAEELSSRLAGHVELQPSPRPGVLPFEYDGPREELLRLHSVQAVYLVGRFDVPRPRALLGDEHLRRLLAMITAARELHPDGAFRSLHMSAAGSRSSVMTRLQEELAGQSGLEIDPEEGDLTLRVRHPLDGAPGWEVLVRLSPRPLATRPWRVCNLEGALNATVAYAMAMLSRPKAGEIVLNLACGSGTLLIERLAAVPAGLVIGCDTSPSALECASANVNAAGLSGRIELYDWDACALPLPARSVDVLFADLPFGNLVGSHHQNVEFYPRILQEAGRVARRGAPFIVITMEVRLIERLLEKQEQWTVEHVLRVGLGGIYPRIYVLRRNP